MKPDFENIVYHLADGLYVLDSDRVITYWNKSAEEITGYVAEEVIGSRCTERLLVHVDADGTNLCGGLCPLDRTVADGNMRDCEAFLRHKEGHRVPVWLRVSALKDQSEEVIGGIELFSDLSNKSAIAEKLRELERRATLDSLTGLPNRSHLEPEIEVRLQEVKRYQTPFGLLFCDIDNFKEFNDNYGHDVGDRVLRAVASTLKYNTRPFDLFGRWGGEEFVGIIRNADIDVLYRVAERCRVLVSKTSVPCDGDQLSITMSIGATIAIPNDSVESILKRADRLLYESKNTGRNRSSIDGLKPLSAGQS
jgi:diguanylate cyclase (GGDEF)-like protein/PAS domain S-box-containing protein